MDPRFATAPARRDHWNELLPVLREWLDTYATVDDAVRALSGARIPTVPMLSPEEVVEHPQMTTRQAFPEVPHVARGTVRVTASPFHVDGQPVHPAGAAPREVGEHTREILERVAGYERARIDDLEARGVVSTH
jgi:crotonobetainyl-CoA:carnitine CoA-transferase CaiB-like acyl-CoA transferase